MTDQKPELAQFDIPKEPPALVPDSWLSGCLIACERVYFDKSNVTIIAGTYNRINAGITWPLEKQFAVLPLFPGNLYVRFNSSKSGVINWAIWRRLVSWAGELSGQAKILAAGNCQVNDLNHGLAEFKIDSLGNGLALTPERREMFDRHKQGEMIFSYELYGDGKFISALGLVFAYTTVESANNDESSTDASRDTIRFDGGSANPPATSG